MHRQTQSNAKTNLTQIAELAHILKFGSFRPKMTNDEAMLMRPKITAGRSSLIKIGKVRSPYLRRIAKKNSRKLTLNSLKTKQSANFELFSDEE